MNGEQSGGTGGGFGQRLEAWRVARGLTRRQAGALLGVKVRTMDSWRRGDHQPQGALLAIIERAMGEPAQEAKP